MNYFDFVLSFLLAIGGLVGVPMPVAVPPAPDEPALLRVVPKDAIAFLAWNGLAAAQPKSPNLTERLAAEPEVRAMVAQLAKALAGVVGGEREPLAIRAVQTLLAGVQQPGCVFVRTYQKRPRPYLEGGLVVRFGAEAGGPKELLGLLRDRMTSRPAGAARHEDVVVDGVTFTALGTDVEHTFVGWAELDGWLAVAIGKDTPAQIVAGLRRNDPGIADHPGYGKLAPACSVARPSTKAFLDLAKLRGLISEQVGEGAGIEPLLAALGLQGATAMVSQTGLEGTGFCQRVHLATTARDGLLGALSGAPLGQDELTHIPLDAQIALSTRVDAQKLEAALARVWAAVLGGGEAALQEYEREFVAEFPRHMGGVRFREDLLANLGEQFTIWNSPGQGGLAVTGATAVWPLRDRAAFAEALDKLMAEAARHVPSKAQLRERGQQPRRNGEYLESFEHGGAKVWWLDILDDDFPLGPSWTVVGDRLVGSLLPQAMRATLDALPPNPDQSLVRLPALNRRGAATGMFCWNAKDVFATGYPLLLPALQAISHEWQREGFDFDLADLPRPAALVPHLGREVVLWEPTGNGYAWTRTGTLPVFDPLALVLLGGLLVVVGDM